MECRPRARAGTTMGRRRERRPHRERASATSPSGTRAVTPRPAALPGSRLSSRSSGGGTTGLRLAVPDIGEIRYGVSVGILASQSLRHCATSTLVTISLFELKIGSLGGSGVLRSPLCLTRPSYMCKQAKYVSLCIRSSTKRSLGMEMSY